MRGKWISFSALLLVSFFIQTADAEIYSSISGRVIAEDTGQSVADVGLFALKIGTREQHHEITDKSGAYVLKNLTSGKYAILFGKENSPYLIEEKPIEVVLPKGKNVVNANYILKLGGSVSGTVYGADGVTPLSKVNVSANVLNPQPEWVLGFRGTRTDSNGRFLLQGLPDSDNCVVEVDVQGRAKLSKIVKVTKGKTTENVNFIVKRDDITGITGHVRSSIDNKLIKGALVVLRDNSGNDIGLTRTDDMGKYSIIGVSPGVYKVTAFWPTGESLLKKTNILVESGKQTEVNFEFDKPSPN